MTDAPPALPLAHLGKHCRAVRELYVAGTAACAVDLDFRRFALAVRAAACAVCSDRCDDARAVRTHDCVAGLQRFLVLILSGVNSSTRVDSLLVHCGLLSALA
jgi:hypothetical protein